MDSKIMKNIVILKNLPSNIIDEAIVILKDNYQKKICLTETMEIKANEGTDKNEDKSKGKDYILHEAEMIINNYISEIKEEKKMKKVNFNALEKQYKRLKKMLFITGTLVFLSILLILI